MPGCLVLVVGPSGAGKDTLIRLARTALADDPRYVFPRRLVTRPPSADEDNDQIDEAGFAEGCAAGRFILSWRAHGLGYALPAEAGRLVAGGHVVVCNVSRRIVTEARAACPKVSVVEIAAPPEILARRLAARGRPEDGDLAARLAREAQVDADLRILNTGAPETGAERLIAHLRAC
ncbi:phosphonate metabolism protein/1,5-bisphosphokinase (PRPP-forming) PhnN [Methylobacterium sp. NEAU K]|uniref:phosphonate metabolism protein/1,5-bisphosphokinase (PRPP-forming) PhnN n=1 Tax=Methylobacterium sp. NEAU K TaxID=3064946 RepID=UPI0027351FE0|nr:phosphonate metabolism protein/1,5-bisphosphokinase (PRPP-forming) PhnN [Methylobacterium sp. NEAU K]MDP4004526.1 phosphonate metabolism protein/1,5-bisphosphokinase (PRPP-forming) PhnN [Methylobacterium sp. NEAU K]